MRGRFRFSKLVCWFANRERAWGDKGTVSVQGKTFYFICLCVTDSGMVVLPSSLREAERKHGPFVLTMEGGSLVMLI